MTRACLLSINIIIFMLIISQKNHSIECQFDVKKSLQNSNKNLQNVHQKSYSPEVRQRSKSFLVEHDKNEKCNSQQIAMMKPRWISANAHQNATRNLLTFIKNIFKCLSKIADFVHQKFIQKLFKKRIEVHRKFIRKFKKMSANISWTFHAHKEKIVVSLMSE